MSDEKKRTFKIPTDEDSWIVKQGGHDRQGRSGRVLWTELSYPQMDGNPDQVRIGLTHVRAADELLISYDFDRDGWVIQMDLTRDMGGYMDVVKEKQEVAFIPAWNEIVEETNEGK